MQYTTESSSIPSVLTRFFGTRSPARSAYRACELFSSRFIVTFHRGPVPFDSSGNERECQWRIYRTCAVVTRVYPIQLPNAINFIMPLVLLTWSTNFLTLMENDVSMIRITLLRWADVCYVCVIRYNCTRANLTLYVLYVGVYVCNLYGIANACIARTARVCAFVHLR